MFLYYFCVCNVFAEPGFLTNVVRLCVTGTDSDKGTVEEGNRPSTSTGGHDTWVKDTAVLLFCFAGLQICYLTWGLLQERIMSYEYGAEDGIPGEYFKNSQFLVFMNRILAFFTACTVLSLTRPPTHKAPLYKYSYSSFSNIMSSWFQYEALKFVSFPVQVLAKASKVIPVMLMGKLVSNKSFKMYEYATAVMISLGITLFLYTSQDNVKDDNKVTTFSGIVCLLGYLAFDAFTANWQGELFATYKMSSVQMMAGVNLFSVLFTTVSLIQQGGFMESISFMTRHSIFIWHIVLLSVCSAGGQLIIYYTISRFGPVTFTIIMVIRQGLAILLSCLTYGHPVTAFGILGICMVFTAMLLRVYFNQQHKAAEKQKATLAAAAQKHPPTDSVTVPMDSVKTWCRVTQICKSQLVFKKSLDLHYITHEGMVSADSYCNIVI